MKDALNKPTWRRRRQGDYREAWRDAKAAGICTTIRTAIKIDDFRKAVEQRAELAAVELRERLKWARREAVGPLKRWLK